MMSAANKQRLSLFLAICAVAAVMAAMAWQAWGKAGRWTDDRGLSYSDAVVQPRTVLWQTPELVGEFAAAAEADLYEPCLSADGRELFFVSGRPGENARIMRSRRQQGRWLAAEEVISVNSDADDIGPCLSADGQILFFSSNRAGGQGGFDIWYARRDGDDWSTPSHLGAALNSSGHDYAPTPCDLGGMYFVSNRLTASAASATPARAWQATIRQGERQQYDIFYIDVDALQQVLDETGGAEDGKDAESAATDPVAIRLRHPDLNTAADEGSCSLSPTGDFLYFASDRASGQGGFDLYRCRRSPDGQLGPVEALGPDINGAANETDPVLGSGGFTLYFSSDREPKAGYRLYQSWSREVHFVSGGGLADLAWHWWALLAAVLLFLLFVCLSDEEAQWQRSKRCILASILAHAVILFLCSVVPVLDEILPSSEDEGEALVQIAVPQVALAAAIAADQAAAVDVQAMALPAAAPARQQMEAALRPAVAQPMSAPAMPTAIPTAMPSPATTSSVAAVAAPSAQPSMPMASLDVAAPSTQQPQRLAQQQSSVVDQALQPQQTRSQTTSAPPLPRQASSELAALPVDAVAPNTPSQPAVANVATQAMKLPQQELAVSLPQRSAAAAEAASKQAAQMAQGDHASLDHSDRQAQAAPRRSGQALAAAMPGPQAVPEASGPAGQALQRPGQPAGLDAIKGLLGVGQLSGTSSLGQRSAAARQAAVKEFGGSEASEKAVRAGLAFLARCQDADGHWTRFDGGLPKPGQTSSHDMALTGLAVLAFLAADHRPDAAGPYRQHVDKALRYLVAKQADDGDLRGRGGSLYDHGIATVALAEAAAMTGDDRLRTAALQAGSFILQAQGPDGGWRYKPGEKGDTSVMGWQAMALRSLSRIEFELPTAKRQKALQWLESVSSHGDGALAVYQRGRSPTPAMVAEAAYARLLFAATPSEAQLQTIGRYVLEHPEDPKGRYYYWYYGAHLLMQVQGPWWPTWNARVRQGLVGIQEQTGDLNGSYPTDTEWSRRGGRVYSTALATLTLAVYYRYLPMHAEDKTSKPKAGVDSKE